MLTLQERITTHHKTTDARRPRRYACVGDFSDGAVDEMTVTRHKNMAVLQHENVDVALEDSTDSKYHYTKYSFMDARHYALVRAFSDNVSF
jgi:hypothetical protein